MSVYVLWWWYRVFGVMLDEDMDDDDHEADQSIAEADEETVNIDDAQDNNPSNLFISATGQQFCLPCSPFTV